MPVRTPAIVAGALFASLVGTASAHAATAYIAPVDQSGSSVKISATIAVPARDDCRISYNVGVFTSDIALGPIWQSRVAMPDVCDPSPSRTFWEDGSISQRVAGPTISRARLIAGTRYYVGMQVCAGRYGGSASTVGCHTSFRSFWATATAPVRSPYSLPTVRLADCRLGPC